MNIDGAFSRREAIFILAQWLETGDFPARMISDGENRSFVTDLTATVLRRFRTLDWMLRQFVRKMPVGETRAALLLGAAQLFYMPSVKDYAAINETVEAAKKASRASAPFVNGVLRSMLRERDRLLEQLARQKLGVRHSHPEALVARWLKRYGGDKTVALCEFNNSVPSTFLAYPPEAESRYVELEHGMRVDEVPGYGQGDFIVQDPATAGAVELLEVQSGMRVLDACAAPGGKTIQIAWRLKGSGKLVACDTHDDRLKILRENLQRTGIDGVETLKIDMTEERGVLSERAGGFDRILLDVPCSNSGVLRRRADARWRWNEKRMKTLVELQRRILENAASLLAPGGRLVYSTCSLEPEENLEQVEAFLKRHGEFSMVGSRESFPPESGFDGAFAAALEFSNRK